MGECHFDVKGIFDPYEDVFLSADDEVIYRVVVVNVFVIVDVVVTVVVVVVVIVNVVATDNSAVVDGAAGGVSVTKGVEDARWMNVTNGTGKVCLDVDDKGGFVDDSKSHGCFSIRRCCCRRHHRRCCCQ